MSEPDLPAGDFSSWLDEIQGALRGEHGSDVPCGGCTACCRSSQFIHVGPDEANTLAHIPGELLFPAPGLPDGHVLMGYDDQGHCPMLIDDRCSIYAHRPQACRTYDCRVFPATGIEPDPDRQPLVAERARRWEFSFGDDAARTRHDAVRAAATFVGEYRSDFPDGVVPTSPTQLAVLAIEVHDAFLRHDPVEDVKAVVVRRAVSATANRR